jgi:hypothetical protein
MTINYTKKSIPEYNNIIFQHKSSVPYGICNPYLGTNGQIKKSTNMIDGEVEAWDNFQKELKKSLEKATKRRDNLMKDVDELNRLIIELQSTDFQLIETKY